MSKNIDQIFTTNPITTNVSTDLMYFGQSPYGSGNDAAMTFSNFAAQFVTASSLPLSVGDGGTDSTSFTAYAVICGGTTSTGALQSIAGVGTSGQVLTSNGPGLLPTFQTSSSGSGTVNSGTTNELAWYAANGTAVSGLATADNGVLITSASGVPSISSTLPSGLTVPGYQASLTLPLSIANGGTGVNAATTTPTANTYAAWNSNKNFSSNNFIPAYTSTATAAGTTTLTISSTYQQYFTGTTTQTVKMPVTSTLVLGFPFFIVNKSTGNVTVESSGSNTIATLSSGTALILTCANTSSTTAAGWSATEISSGSGSSVWTVGAGTDSGIGGDGTATAAGNYSLAYGNTSCAATDNNSFVFGTGNTSNASGWNVVFGDSNSCTGSEEQTFVMGASCSAAGGGSNFIFGSSASSGSGNNSLAFGSSTVTNAYCFAFGDNCQANGGYGFSFGFDSQANAASSFAFGTTCITNGEFSFSFGDDCTTTASYSFAIGTVATANHSGSVVWGDSNSSPVQDSAANQWVQTFTGGYYWNISNSSGLAAEIDTHGNVTNNMGQCDTSKTITAPSSGGTVTLATTNRRTILNPSGTLATLTIHMPPSPVNGQLQTVTTTQIITALTVSGNGNTIIGEPTTLAAGQSFTMIYDTGTTTWYPG